MNFKKVGSELERRKEKKKKKRTSEKKGGSKGESQRALNF